MLVSIDGRQQPQLEDFAAHIASAATLERFYPSSDAFTAITDTIAQAATLYNDLEYKQKAERLRDELASMDPGSAEYQRLKPLFDAYRKNIRQEEFEVPELADG